MNLPFDLEKALAGEPVVTRDGRSVKGICVTNIPDKYWICGYIDGIAHIDYTWTKEGSYYLYRGGALDLFMLNTMPDDNNP